MPTNQPIEDDPKSDTEEELTKKSAEKIMLSRKSRALSMIPTMPGKTGMAQWENIMKKFHESHKVTCKALPKDIPVVSRPRKRFPTGSSYEGMWNLFGVSGRGSYVFPQQGVKYVGDFSDGLFHGEGELQYDNGAIIKGKFKKGVMLDRTLVFADGLEYKENHWNYCRFPDRRFTVEYDSGIEPAGRSYKTAEGPIPEIPPGYFDTGDGFYDPLTKTIYKYDDLTSIVRSPCEKEQKWIIENCRKDPDGSVGPCSFLYEEFKEPAVEAEELPAPAARTKTYEDENLALEQERNAFYVGVRRSRRSVSRVKGQPLFSKFSHRRVTDMEYDDQDFYRASYMGYSSEPGGSHKQSFRQSGIVFEPRRQSAFNTDSRTSEFAGNIGSARPSNIGSTRPSNIGSTRPSRATVASDETVVGIFPGIASENIGPSKPPPNW